MKRLNWFVLMVVALAFAAAACSPAATPTTAPPPPTSAPLWWIPTLHNAEPAEREKYEISRDRRMIIWDPDKCAINDEVRIEDYLMPARQENPRLEETFVHHSEVFDTSAMNA